MSTVHIFQLLGKSSIIKVSIIYIFKVSIIYYYFVLFIPRRYIITV